MSFLARALAFAALTFVPALSALAEAQAPDQQKISWSVINRFRLFQNRTDFERMERAHVGSSVLEAERLLSRETHGEGWAKDIPPDKLCVSANTGRIEPDCHRDGVLENYLNADSYAASFTFMQPGFEDANCRWSDGDTSIELNCGRPYETRVPRDRQQVISVVATAPSGATASDSVTPAVRDILIVGMGDSIASGEGNPDVPIPLTGKGFCFRSFKLGGPDFYGPAPDGANVAHACDGDKDASAELEAFLKVRARWLWNPCHRSLYSYQTRAALALAIDQKQAIVSYIPLGCSGATIAEGIKGQMPPREHTIPEGTKGTANAKIESQDKQLSDYLDKSARRPDLVLLTVGANDIGFAELVANVMITDKGARKRARIVHLLGSKEESRAKLEKVLTPQFEELRNALSRFMGPDLSKVIYTVYGNPAQRPGGACPATRMGFDIHPDFGIDEQFLAETVEFVENEFIPRLRDLVTCANGACPASRAMTYVDAHRPAFAEHGFCAASASDPSFDRECLRDGGSFGNLKEALKCNIGVEADRMKEYRAYASRARWIRTVNDAYFGAMAYPSSLLLKPLDIHDALWGVTSGVHGGAIHPTAEGHAAMADAALDAMKCKLDAAACKPPAAP